MKGTKPKGIVVEAPEFRSEAEEAEWWDRHQELIADLLLKHGRRGAVPTKNVSVRLPIPISSVREGWRKSAASATRR